MIIVKNILLNRRHKFIIFSHFLDISKQLDSTILIHTDTLACFVETKLFLLNAVEMASAARRMASVGELRFSFMLLEDYSEYHMFLICVRKTLINETQKGHPLYWIVVGCVAAPYFKLLFFLRHEINLNRKMIYVKSPSSFFFS